MWGYTDPETERYVRWWRCRAFGGLLAGVASLCALVWLTISEGWLLTALAVLAGWTAGGILTCAGEPGCKHWHWSNWVVTVGFTGWLGGAMSMVSVGIWVWLQDHVGGEKLVAPNERWMAFIVPLVVLGIPAGIGVGATLYGKINEPDGWGREQ